MELVKYFKDICDNIPEKWNVESALKEFGIGKNNEGSLESKAIKRYYVEPSDTRFRQIFLNYSNNNVDSIVWFFNTNENSKLSIAELKSLFGNFQIHNIIYDETTQFSFHPQLKTNIRSVNTNIPEWIKIRKDGIMHYDRENKEHILNENYLVSNLTFIIRTSPNRL